MRFEVGLRGELDEFRLVAISMGDDELGIARIVGSGDAEGNSGSSVSSSSSSSSGKRMSLLLKSPSAIA